MADAGARHAQTCKRRLAAGGLCIRLGLLVLCLQVDGVGAAPSSSEADPPIGFDLQVPIDHGAPAGPHGTIYYEFGAPFDASLPTVFAVADAQQFHVRRGGIAALQAERFGDGVNVVGIVGRGSSSDFVEETVDAGGEPDWLRAWEIFQSAQWLDDIEAVRKAVVGAEGRICLYGESGGAFLVHQYLSRYGQHVDRAVTPAPVHPYLEHELGLNSDRFWAEIGAHDPILHEQTRRALALHDGDRETLVMTLQRQNFFVPPDQLQQERARLIRALATGDDAFYAERREAYQVDAVQEIMASLEAIPIRVRLFEFFVPLIGGRRLEGEALYPNLEVMRNISRPLVELHRQGRIGVPAFDSASLHTLTTQVLVVAGRWDHTVDYRAAIALAAVYPQGLLFIADDDHMFGSFKESGHFNHVVQAFLGHGLRREVFATALDEAQAHRWRE